jgi:hypothetical protein
MTKSAKASSEKLPAEYVAFRGLLRQVVKQEPKPTSAPASSDKG